MGSNLIYFVNTLYLIQSAAKVEARKCTFEIDGTPKVYTCPRSQYCCRIGCCQNPTFQFYQLWYYWLMVIFMLVVCSGGQWWYRYWVQGGGRDPSLASRPGVPPGRPPRVAYSARDTVAVVHHVWKPTYTNYPGGPRCSPPPTYSQMQMEENARPKPSPYMQVYGPPPSYDSVVGETRAERRRDRSTGREGRPETRTEVTVERACLPELQPLSDFTEASQSTEASFRGAECARGEESRGTDHCEQPLRATEQAFRAGEQSFRMDQPIRAPEQFRGEPSETPSRPSRGEFSRPGSRSAHARPHSSPPTN